MHEDAAATKANDKIYRISVEQSLLPDTDSGSMFLPVKWLKRE